MATKIMMNKLTNWRWWTATTIINLLLTVVFLLYILGCVLAIFDWVVDKLADLLYSAVKKLKRFVKRGERLHQ